MNQKKSWIMDEAQMERTLTRIAHEIIEKDTNPEQLVIIGILRRGASLAKKIVEKLHSITGVNVPYEELDISLYRDDLEEKSEKPLVREIHRRKDWNEKTVVLVDDVIYTGRTARAAMDAVLTAARPQAVRLAVLVDRGHRELPIRPDFVGKNVPTSRTEQIEVLLPQWDNAQGVILRKK